MYLRNKYYSEATEYDFGWFLVTSIVYLVDFIIIRDKFIWVVAELTAEYEIELIFLNLF